MPVHQPILPSQAIKLVEARNLAAAGILLADFAAAGLIKTYALMREIRPAGEPPEMVRDSQILPEEWGRIVASDKIDVALNGGTVRLEGSLLKGGTPSVQITGVSFSEAALVKVLDRYCAGSPSCATKSHHTPPEKAQMEVPFPTRQSSSRSKKEVPPIKAGTLTVSIAQAMQATSLGRTKINDLMKTGSLEKRKVHGRTLITIESIERLVGAKVFQR